MNDDEVFMQEEGKWTALGFSVSNKIPLKLGLTLFALESPPGALRCRVSCFDGSSSVGICVAQIVEHPP